MKKIQKKLHRQSSLPSQFITNQEYNSALEKLLYQIEVQNKYTKHIQKVNIINSQELCKVKYELNHILSNIKQDQNNKQKLKNLTKQLTSKLEENHLQLNYVMNQMLLLRRKIKSMQKQIIMLSNKKIYLQNELLEKKCVHSMSIDRIKKQLGQKDLQKQIDNYLKKEKHGSCRQFCMEVQADKNYDSFIQRLSKSIIKDMLIKQNLLEVTQFKKLRFLIFRKLEWLVKYKVTIIIDQIDQQFHLYKLNITVRQKNMFSLVNAFSFEESLDDAYTITKQKQEKKRKENEKYKLNDILNDNGITIAQLFGYHLYKQLNGNTLASIGLQQKVIRVNEHDFTKIIKKIWLNMDKFENLIPVLFQLFRDPFYNVISLKKVDQYLQICGQMNDFMVKLKTSVPTIKIKKLINVIRNVSERQDLRQTNSIHKHIIQDIFKEQLGRQYQIDPQLLVQNEVQYKILLGEQYLLSGKKIKEFFHAQCIKKIIKVMREVGILKGKQRKRKKQKKTQKKQEVNKKNSSMTVKQKIVKNFIEQKNLNQPGNKNFSKFIAKQILYDCIDFAIETKSQEKNILQGAINKSLYITEPQIPELQFEGIQYSDVNKICIGGNQTAIFIKFNEGFMIDMYNGSIVGKFRTNPSNLVKDKAIIDYTIFENILYFLRQDGLLYSWSNIKSCYCDMVQTSFNYNSHDIYMIKGRNWLTIQEGLIFINCSHPPVSHIQVYNLKLLYLNSIGLNRTHFSLTGQTLKECLFMKKNICKQYNNDYVFKNFEHYKQILSNQGYLENVFQFGQHIFNIFGQNITSIILSDHINWVLAHQKYNIIPIDANTFSRIEKNELNQIDLQYLMKYNYIGSFQSAIKDIQDQGLFFLATYNRRFSMITLFQDFNLKEISPIKPYLSLEQFLQWVASCNLTMKEFNTIKSKFLYNPEGLIDFTQMVQSQHYLRILDKRKGQYSTNKYKNMSLPSIMVKYMIGIPSCGVIVLVTMYPCSHSLIIVSMTTGSIIKNINLNKSKAGRLKPEPLIKFCSYSGYVISGYDGYVCWWNIRKIITGQFYSRPSRIFKLSDQPFLDVLLLYNANSLVTMSQNFCKIWDLSELFSSQNSQKVTFRLISGYYAKEQSIHQTHGPKKKIYSIGNNKFLFANSTYYHQNILGIMSSQNEKMYLKMVYLSKFYLTIPVSKIYEQIPLKIIKQFQQMARKNKYSDHSSLEPHLSSKQHEIISIIQSQFQSKQLIYQKTQDNINGHLKVIESLNYLYGIFGSIDKMVKNISQYGFGKQLKWNIIFLLLTKDFHLNSINSIFKTEIINMYSLTSQNYNRKQLLEDITDEHDRKIIRRILYLCSLIDRYAIPYDCQSKQLIVNQNNPNFVDQSMVENLIGKQIINERYLNKSISLINSLKFDKPISILQNIIKNFIPTEMKIICIRYYKQILKTSQCYEFQDYISNKFVERPNHKQLVQSLSKNNYQSVHAHIEGQNLKDYIWKTIVPRYPQIVYDNYKLIIVMMGHKILNEQQAINYSLVQNDSSGNQKLVLHLNIQDKYNINQFMQNIRRILIDKNIKLPNGCINYSFFIQILQNCDHIILEDVFYTYWKGSRNTRTIYTEQFKKYLWMTTNKLSLIYQPQFWKQLVGSQITILLPYLNQLKMQTADLSIINRQQFIDIVEVMVHTKVQDLICRCAYCSLNNYSYIQQFQKQQNLKSDINTYINVSHLYKYMEQISVSYIIQKKDIKQIKNKPIKISFYRMFTELQNHQNYLSQKDLMTILSYNVELKFSLKQVKQYLKKLRWVPEQDQIKYVDPLQIPKFIRIDMKVLGQILINKYIRVNIMVKMVQIDSMISVKHLKELFTPLISKCIFQKQMTANKLFVQTNIVQDKVNEIMIPSFQALVSTVLYSIRLYYGLIIKLLQDFMINQTISIKNICRYFQTRAYNEGIHILPVFIHFLTNSNDSVTKIQIQPLILTLTKQHLYFQPIHIQYTKKINLFMKNNQNISLFEIFMRYAMPHEIITILNNVEYLITKQNLNDILQTQDIWLASFQPYIKFGEFIKHLYNLDVYPNLMYNFCRDCVLKVGLKIFYTTFQHYKFSQFLVKIRLLSKKMSLVTTYEIAYIYQQLFHESNQLSYDRLFNLLQQHISLNEKILWITQYLNESINQQNNFEQQFLSNDSIENKIDNLICKYTTNSTQRLRLIQDVIQSLHYGRYLLKHRLNNNKNYITSLYQCQNENFTQLCNDYGMISTQQISYLRKYLSTTNFNQTIINPKSYESDELTDSEILIRLKNNSQYINYIKKNPQLINSKVGKKFSETMFFENQPFFYSYANFRRYIEENMLKLLKTNKFRQLILISIQQSLRRINFTLQKLYKLLDLYSYDNIKYYLQYFLPINFEIIKGEQQLSKFLKPYLLQAFYTYNHSGVEVHYPLTLSTFKDLFMREKLFQTELSQTHIEMYKKMDLWGTGFVNLNDIQQYRIKHSKNPYVYINMFLHTQHPELINWSYIAPPVSLINNISIATVQLLKAQDETMNKVKTIKKTTCMLILGKFLTEQHRFYIQHEFKVGDQHLNLFKLLDWTQSSTHNTVDSSDKQYYEICGQLMTEYIEPAGGLYNFIRKKYHSDTSLRPQEQQIQQKALFWSLMDSIRPIRKESFEKIIFKKNPTKSTRWLEQILLQMIQDYNTKIRGWNSNNNSIVMYCNSLASSQFNMLKIMYYQHTKLNTHQLFDELAVGSEQFTLLTLFNYINTRSKQPYSLQNIRLIFDIIDVNHDQKISYSEFVKFWTALKQIYPKQQKQKFTKIHGLKQELRMNTVKVLSGLLKSGEEDVIDMNELSVRINVTNKQKLMKLMQIMQDDSKVYDYASLDKTKLRVMLRNMEQQKKKKQEPPKGINYHLFVHLLSEQILRYMSSKSTVKSNLIKYICTICPNFGTQICHYIHEKTSWQPQKIRILLTQNNKTYPTLTESHKSNNNRNNMQNIKSLIIDLNVIHKVQNKIKSILKPIYGQSIAMKLYLNELIQTTDNIHLQFQQILAYLMNCQSQINLTIPLPYQQKYTLLGMERNNEEKENDYNYNIADTQLQKLDCIREKITGEKIIKIIKQYELFVCYKVQLKDRQMCNRSKIKVNLLSNIDLYLDGKIVLGSLDEKKSCSHSIITCMYPCICQTNNYYHIKHHYNPHKLFISLSELKLQPNCGFSTLPIMQIIVQFAYYCFKQYNICGLMSDWENIYIEYEQFSSIRLMGAYQGIRLNVDGNYIDGINPIICASNGLYAPEIHQEIYSQYGDVYSIAYILWWFFTGQKVSASLISSFTEHTLWAPQSYLHQICKQKLNELKNINKIKDNQFLQKDLEGLRLWYSLIYECTCYEWYERPKLQQVLITIQFLMKYVQYNNQQVGYRLGVAQSMIELLKRNQTHKTLCISKDLNLPICGLHELSQIFNKLPHDVPSFNFYITMLKQYIAQINNDWKPTELDPYMSILVNFLLCSKRQQLGKIALSAYKTIINSNTIQKYLHFCDQQWKIQEFDVQQKLKQLSLKNRIYVLPKSSNYYMELTTLSECRLQLLIENNANNNKSQSTRKMAISFVYSALISNNVNKVYAVYRSGLVGMMYPLLLDVNLHETILKIYNIVSESYLADKASIRTIDESYKVAMVIYNTIDEKNQKSVIDLLTYMNDYYHFGGQQCNQTVIKKICDEQLVTLPTLTMIFNNQANNIFPNLRNRILINLSYNLKYYNILNSFSVSAIQTRIKSINEVQQLKEQFQHIQSIHHNNLSTIQLSFKVNRFNILTVQKIPVEQIYIEFNNLVNDCILLYKYGQDSQKLLHINNMQQTYDKILQISRVVCKKYLYEAQHNKHIQGLLHSSLILHKQLLFLWRNDVEGVSFIMYVLQYLYGIELWYVQHKSVADCLPMILELLEILVKNNPIILINHGYIFYFMRIMKKQYNLLENYVHHQVQNIHLSHTYAYEAQFRLNTIYHLLNNTSEDIHRMLVIAGLHHYITQFMLNSKLELDLRFYIANSDIIPYRYCHPLRSQAITICGFVLPMHNSAFKIQLVNKLIPNFLKEKQILDIIRQKPQSKMKWVQSLWFFASIISCEDQRIRYEFVNMGIQQKIEQIIKKYAPIAELFPKMTETIRSGIFSNVYRTTTSLLLNN